MAIDKYTPPSPDTAITGETISKNHLVSDYLDPNDYRDLSIMVIDDTTASLMRITPLLSDYGYAVRPMKDSRNAIKSVLDDPPDLIILDVVMPAPDGFEVCRQLKKNPRSAHIPIILLSALEDEAHKIKGFELGAVDYITKPFKGKEVLARVKTHISSGLLKQQLEQRNQRLSQLVREYNENKVRFRNIFASNSVPMLLLNSQNHSILYGNPSCHRALGYHKTEKELTGKFFGDILQEAEKNIRYLTEHFPQDTMLPQFLRFITAQGKIIAYSVQYYGITLAKQECIFAILTATPASQSHKITAAQQEGNSSLATNPRPADPFAPLHQAMLHHQAKDNPQLFNNILGSLLEIFHAREAHLLLQEMPPNTLSSMETTPLSPIGSSIKPSKHKVASEQSLRVIAQKHKYNAPMSLIENETLTSPHILCSMVYQYGQTLFCDQKSAPYIAQGLRRFMHNLEIPWILLIPLTSIYSIRGSIILFGEGDYWFDHYDINYSELLGQHLGYTLDKIGRQQL